MQDKSNPPSDCLQTAYMVKQTLYLMVLILDGKSEIGAHVRSILCYLICFRHLIRPKAVTIRSIFLLKSYFPSCVRNMF